MCRASVVSPGTSVSVNKVRHSLEDGPELSMQDARILASVFIRSSSGQFMAGDDPAHCVATGQKVLGVPVEVFTRLVRTRSNELWSPD